jgi:hypothetical protein
VSPGAFYVFKQLIIRAHHDHPMQGSISMHATSCRARNGPNPQAAHGGLYGVVFSVTSGAFHTQKPHPGWRLIRGMTKYGLSGGTP